MIRLIPVLVAVVLPLAAADPARAPWILAADANSGQIRPDVHSVDVTPGAVVVRSAGLSLAYLGPLQSPPEPSAGIQKFEFHIPRAPQAAPGPHSHLPPGAAGVFLNGMPVWNQFEASSYEGRNIWHYDPLFVRPGAGHAPGAGLLEGLLQDRQRHSPLIGYALDGYPIYGPWAMAEDGLLRRMRAGYQLRQIVARETLPDGTRLTPGQYGPAVGALWPLGTFAEDYDYAEGRGDLDQFNGRFVVTAEYPDGTYAYFLASDSSGRLAFPYLLAGEFRGVLRTDAAAPTIVAKLGAFVSHRDPGQVKAGSAALIEIELLDNRGVRVRHPEFVHERPIHLMIVSSDRSDFAHIHPEVGSDDKWRVAYTFSHGGRYRAYAEFTLPGGSSQTQFFEVIVQGPARRPGGDSLNSPSLLTLEAPGRVRAHEDTELRFHVTRPNELQPWLGAWAHVAVVGEGLASFAHAHPLTEGTTAIQESEAHTHAAQALGPPPGEIRVPVSFPAPGVYKIWVQIQSAGEVHAIPFTLRAGAGAGGQMARQPLQTIPKDAIRIRIDVAGYQPARVEVPAGKPITLAFERTSEPNCGTRVVFPALGIGRDVPLGGTVLIELPPQPAGELRFACGMGMNRGSLIVR